MEEGQDLVFDSNFGGMTSHIMSYGNMISVSVKHSFSSAYTALSDIIGGHF
jgi:hypothetical protein